MLANLPDQDYGDACETESEKYIPWMLDFKMMGHDWASFTDSIVHKHPWRKCCRTYKGRSIKCAKYSDATLYDSDSSDDEDGNTYDKPKYFWRDITPLEDAVARYYFAIQCLRDRLAAASEHQYPRMDRNL